ncbi:Acyl-CoA synthetase (AMP-forming)/AMP-acid ligase II [Geosmithia morbida]|uniref:Acyl-CoA synthetase (AMP-forming)/AMP-acid ligase II n=1 Tax=Geosmithia morbida TaxID=1094350 RepID=A0A9P4Z2R6_9HYPO|nr:Acyl-CoA synthetase (AMP-forming)/AMP-acid ligase II [Geosmithia morbida]KAF4126163.1 Acyl-CoA synthetase (AMP-forming)/AMP-acid ligase II [Geosmithia morbida]
MSPPLVLAPAADFIEPPRDKATSAQPSAAANGVDEDDSSIKTVDELVRRRARATPNKVIMSYPSSGTDYVDYTLRQLDVFAYRAAMFYKQSIPTRQTSDEKPQTVAILGPSNLEYLVTLMALSKLGHTVLFLSTRISQEAIENLVMLTGARFLVADERFNDVTRDTRASIPSLQTMRMVSRSAFEFEIEAYADTKMDYHLDAERETSNLVFIIHSSGSTGLPKPIYQTQRSAVANYASSMNMKAFITLPLYHNHGICNLFRAIYCGKSIHLYNADLPLTHDYLVKIMKKHRFEIFYGVPFALKLLAESDQGMNVLRDLKVVMYGGSACPDELGNRLVENGVNIVGHYGATEVGQLMTSFRPPADKDWNYVRESPKLTPYLRWIPRGSGLFECCVLDGWPAKVASNQPDGSYLTKDLFAAHPSLPRAWKYIARRDDTICLVNGEMFNPVTTEGAIRSSKHVTEAVVFGSGRPALGVLIIPAASLTGKSQDEVSEIVWPVVKEACRNVESYARISKSMVKILPAGCEYPRTDKGSVVRHAFYKTYAKEIEEAYDAEYVGRGDVRKLTMEELRDFLRKSVTKALAKEVSFDDETDLFSLGLDSLQAIQVRSDILSTVDIGGNQLGQTVVFDKPSISRLSCYLLALSSDGKAEATASVEEEMRELIEKYTLKGIQRVNFQSSVAVTGVTGSLGAHLVSKLSSDASVSTIYCLVRAKSNAEASRRVKASLIQRRVYHTISPKGRAKIVSLSADLSNAQLGLPEEAYQELVRSLKTVIHCAWSVNFNMRLSSFEDSNIAGLANLISLCQSSDASATFNFCSSVSAVTQSTVVPVPETVPDVRWAQGMGYAQSKNVAENLCYRAADRGVTARVLRLGQIVADTQHGVWNSTEAIPLMLQSALTIGALPKIRETPSWLPVDTAAQAVAEISLSEEAGSTFANVTNPKLFDWTEDLLPALKAAGLRFEEVEPKEWVRRLRASDPDPTRNPPIKLVDFFAAKYDKDDFVRSKTYVTDTACTLSPALAEAPVLDRDMVKSFVTHFRENAWSEPQVKKTKSVIFAAGAKESTRSAVATGLSQELRVPCIAADALHHRECVDNAEAPRPLSDSDLTLRLERLAERALEEVEESGHNSVVVGVSPLGKSHRDYLRRRIGQSARTMFLDIQGDSTGDRPLYEAPGVDELDVLPVDDGSLLEEEAVDEAMWILRQSGIVTDA